MVELEPPAPDLNYRKGGEGALVEGGSSAVAKGGGGPPRARSVALQRQIRRGTGGASQELGKGERRWGRGWERVGLAGDKKSDEWTPHRVVSLEFEI
jgi:hypothetical protein